MSFLSRCELCRKLTTSVWDLLAKILNPCTASLLQAPNICSCLCHSFCFLQTKPNSFILLICNSATNSLLNGHALLHHTSQGPLFSLWVFLFIPPQLCLPSSAIQESSNHKTCSERPVKDYMLTSLFWLLNIYAFILFKTVKVNISLFL